MTSALKRGGALQGQLQGAPAHGAQSIGSLAALLDDVAEQARARAAAEAAARIAKARKGSGLEQTPGGTPYRPDGIPVVLLAPADREQARWLDIMGRYATERGYRVDSVAANAVDALAAIVAGVAERIVVVHGHHLAPLVEIVTEQPRPVSQSQRRPRLLR